MKVKALVKAALKSDKMKFSNSYEDRHIILIDGCFVPLSKAKEDKRKVDSFYVTSSGKRLELNINTYYIKEATCNDIEEAKKKKKDKKKDKDTKQKDKKDKKK